MNVVLCAHNIHVCVGARTHVMGCTQQRTNNTHLVEKNPFFMAGVVERTGTGRNNPCSASTTLLIIFSSPTFRTCPCRAFALQLGIRTVHLQHKYVQTPPHIVLLAWWQKQCEDHCLEHQGSPYAWMFFPVQRCGRSVLWWSQVVTISSKQLMRSTSDFIHFVFVFGVH